MNLPTDSAAAASVDGVLFHRWQCGKKNDVVLKKKRHRVQQAGRHRRRRHPIVHRQSHLVFLVLTNLISPFSLLQCLQGVQLNCVVFFSGRVASASAAAALAPNRYVVSMFLQPSFGTPLCVAIVLTVAGSVLLRSLSLSLSLSLFPSRLASI